MIWFVLLILAIIAAYFIYQGLRARHIQRCQHDNRTSEHVPESVSEPDADAQRNGDTAAFHNQHSSTPVPPPHDSPSLLYAERNNDADPAAGHNETVREGTSEQLATADSSSADTMDLTAETATLSSEEVGMPANSSEYERTVQADTVVSPTQTDASVISRETDAANASDVHSNDYRSTQTTGVDNNEATAGVNAEEYQSGRNSGHSNNTDSNAGTVAAAIAGVAGVAGVAAVASEPQQQGNEQQKHEHQNSDHQGNQHLGSEYQNSEYQSNQQDSGAQYSATNGHSNEEIDLELGDSTQNDGDDLADDNDELLDFGDLTADISEMLKELNLRESDSPRLEINEKEYQQLKTGDPGEVKPEKIENVADKLRDMLQ